MIERKVCQHNQVDVQAQAYGMANLADDEPRGLVVEVKAYCLECGMRFKMPEINDEVNLDEPWIAEDGFQINIPMTISEVPAIDRSKVN